MALIISLNPNVASWSLGDADIAVSFSGGTTATGNEFFWESNNGTFANRFLATTTFTPTNATKVTTITAKRVWHTASGGTTGVTVNSTYGGTKSSGSGASWDAYMSMANPLAAKIWGSIEFDALESSYEKAGGFLTSNAYTNPTTVSTSPNTSFTFAWHLLGNGTAVARKQGTALSTPILYKIGDKFKIVLEASRAVYYINGLIFATTVRPSSNSQYAYLTFKGIGASLDAFTYHADQTNLGTSSVNVVGVLPIYPHYAYDLTNDNVTNSSTGEDGGMFFRKRGRAKKGFALSFNQRPFTEYDSLMKFWKAHGREEKFVYNDIPTNQSYLVRFESGFQTTVDSPDVITLQASIKEI